MAVGDEQRRRGIGRQLIHNAETEAISRGCCYAFVDTMSYQATDFYRKCGYQLCGEIPDWDSHGHTKHFFKKHLGTE
ncbi:MAG: GNAT family N-acetyltransferase [Planctomycetota bacterium]